MIRIKLFHLLFNSGRARLVCLLSLLFTAGCVATPPVAEDDTGGPIFYPALPDSPRIQYLKTFSSSKDITEADSEFASFVLGKDQGKDAIPITKPYGVGARDGKLYVVDTMAPGFEVIDLVNKTFEVVNGDGGGRMSHPINISFDGDGNKYVTDTHKLKVLQFDRDNRFVKAFGVSGQFKPVDTVVFEDKLFVVDIKDHEIEVLNKDTGVLLYKIGKAGNMEGELFHPTNIKIGADSHIYVSEASNFRVQKFTIDGRHVRNFGSIGTNVGKFARPKGIALDKDGLLYIVDAAFENVQVMDPEGQLLMYFGGPGAYPDSINLPVDVEIDYDNVELFQRYAHPDFKLEYIIMVTSQFGFNKVNVFGYGRMDGMEYIDDEISTSAEN